MGDEAFGFGAEEQEIRSESSLRREGKCWECLGGMRGLEGDDLRWNAVFPSCAFNFIFWEVS